MKKADLKAAKKIDSPLAKYNAAGQLFCVLCNQSVKNELVWTAHINGRAHRDNLQQLKSKKRPQDPSSEPSIPPSKKAAIEAGPSRMSGVASVSDSHFKTPLPVSSTPRFVAPPAPVPRNPVEVKQVAIHNGPQQNTTTFPKTEVEIESTNGMEVEETQPTPTTTTIPGTTLPEGFFDDPKMDAKARGLEYRDPEEIEWENFVREIATEEVKSSTMRVEDEEESTITRELDEIEEQMTHWQRVVDLERKAEEVRRKKLVEGQKIVPDEANDADDEEYNEELDWRSKKH